MGVFYLLLAVFPCAVAQLRERCLRYTTRNWQKCAATVTLQTLSAGWTTRLEINYELELNGERHPGNFRRKYLNRSSAESVPAYEPGAQIEVLVNPSAPDNSYFPLPLSLAGLLYAIPTVAFVVLLVFVGLRGRYDSWSFENKHRIPKEDWKPVQFSQLFSISFPCPALDGPKGMLPHMSADGSVPHEHMFYCLREGYIFSVDLLEYQDPPSPDKVFAAVRQPWFLWPRPSSESKLIYGNLSTGKLLTWPGSVGRIFEYPQPQGPIEVYVSGTSVYTLTTRWYIASDVQEFFDSFLPVAALNHPR